MKYIISLCILSATLFANTLWFNHYGDALKVAKESNKRIYLLIVSQSCKWCKKFEETTLQDKKIMQRLREKYVLVHLSRDRDYIPEKFKVTPVPRHYFLTSQGEKVFPVVGYRDIESFNIFLTDVEKRYKRLEK